MSETKKLPISVHVLTLNSAKTLERTLRSVQICEEILVVDGGSTDATLDIAKKYGARIVLQHPDNAGGKPIDDFSAVRNLALREATQPWIFSLDSDEYASEELCAELQDASHDRAAAYYVPRKYILADGRIVDFATTYPNERLYFFHRDTVEQWVKPVHERPQLRTGTGTKHFRGASLAPIGVLQEYKEKNLRYLRIEAKKSAGKGWGHWFAHRVLHTVRSRCIAFVKLLLIWLLPHRGTRLPLRHELVRFWYGWKLIVETCPLHSRRVLTNR
ncbi:hypothetical protein COU76_03920 [Candidatus Peregrinibacteria bacterium CG10_big_fil_rev_8_21_14_0_10_49_10]|nr:MAG: hypothetical protein COU76_03920 [Candidatus Peregrinibacteria bacterium CG10_big_fil_rev_8_21_14_0_10_49_10]